MRRALVVVVAVGLAACLTPAQQAVIADVACVIAHFELPDTELGKTCGIEVASVPAARHEAVKAAAAAAEHPEIARLARPDGGAP